MSQRVLVLGATGMLGSMVADHLSRQPGLRVTATARDRELAAACARRLPDVAWRALDVGSGEVGAAPELFGDCDWVVNCIGIIKPLVRDDDAFEVERALRVNALFPQRLAAATRGRARVLQIATDCAYSGTRGGYLESDPHDARDVYGKTKSLGETRAEHVHHLRCSIVGPEAGAAKSLLEWFLAQPRGGAVNGFTNHRWNGVTTLHFARLCQGVIASDLHLPHLQHVIPRGGVTKHELLRCFAERFDRGDLEVRPTDAAVAVDRTLATEDDGLNRALWAAAGYAQPPAVPEMIDELARFDYRFARSAPGEPELD